MAVDLLTPRGEEPMSGHEMAAELEDAAKAPDRTLRWMQIATVGPLLLTIIAVWASIRIVQRDTDRRLERVMVDAGHTVEGRLREYAALLGAGRALIGTAEVDAPRVREFLRSLTAERRVPGLFGVGFVATDGVDAGARLVFVEPRVATAALARAVPSADPALLAAAHRARDAGEMVVVHRPGTTDTAGDLAVYLPVYRDGVLPTTVEARRENHVGWMFATLHADEGLAGALGPAEGSVGLRVTDLAGPTPTLLSRSGPLATEDTRPRTMLVGLFGTQWELRFHTGPSFIATRDKWLPWIIGIGGVMVSVLFGGIVWSLGRTRDRAMKMAANQTRTLRATESRMTAMMASLPEPVILLDMSGMIRWGNPAAERFFETPLVALQGHALRDFLPRIGLFELRRDRALSTRATTRSRMDVPVLISLGAAGHSPGVTDVVVIRDRTVQAQLDAELERARDAAVASAASKAQFLANMSHEIRTPMNGVIGMTDLLLDHPLSAEARDVALTIRSSAESLLTIVNDVLDFSKMEAGKLQFEAADFDLRRAVRGAVAVVADAAHTKGLELTADIGADVPALVRGDAGRLRQVLTNLLGNAVRFTESGDVELGLARVDSDDDTVVVLRFWVRDTGIGIPRDVQERLFQPFVQADPSTTRRYGGTGLGLSLARHLVELMGGDLQVTSEPGRGSTFFFTARFDTAASVEPPSAASLPAHTSVLIVDDNATTRRILRRHLEQAGAADITDAPDAASARVSCTARPETMPFSLLLVDMQLPDDDGLHTLAELRRQAPAASAPAVLLTSMLSQEIRARATAAGVAAVLSKPVEREELLTAALRALGAATPQPAVTETPAPAAPAHAGHVLLAEDNRVNQRVAVRHLERLGYSVEVVADGQACLDAFDRTPFAAILMDCQMPVMDGFTATQAIRAREREQGRAATPIIALTAGALEGDRERCLAMGMNDHVSKPLDGSVLAETLRRWTTQ
ncbi:MAG: hypothetical protein AMXMBFR57_14400 [Acidimicrobiia bacterium]